VGQHSASTSQGILDKLFTPREDGDDVLILHCSATPCLCWHVLCLGQTAHGIIRHVQSQVLEAVGEAGKDHGRFALVSNAQATASAFANREASYSCHQFVAQSFDMSEPDSHMRDAHS
jgi:hypothetical protein